MAEQQRMVFGQWGDKSVEKAVLIYVQEHKKIRKNVLNVM